MQGKPERVREWNQSQNQRISDQEYQGLQSEIRVVTIKIKEA